MLNATPITITQVRRSYNGKNGCMCGCIGNYTLPSSADVSAENEAVGYNAYDETSISDRSVKIAIKKVNAALLTYKNHTVDELSDLCVSVGRNSNYAWIAQNGRNTVVYF